MFIRRATACAALSFSLAAALPAHAQGDSPAPKAEDDAATAAAMERARRQADGPLRLIMQASKLRRKGDAEVAADAADAVKPRVAAETAPPAPTMAVLATAQDFAAPVVTDRAALGLVGQTAPAVLGNVAEPVHAETMPVKLIEMVEPAVPPRTLDDLGRRIEVNVDLQVQADGSVSAVAIEPQAPRALKRYITEALLKWRYAPQAMARSQRVQLVFSPAS